MKLLNLTLLSLNFSAFVHRKNDRKGVTEMERESLKQAKMAEMIVKGQIDRLKCKFQR